MRGFLESLIGLHSLANLHFRYVASVSVEASMSETLLKTKTTQQMLGRSQFFIKIDYSPFINLIILGSLFSEVTTMKYCPALKLLMSMFNRFIPSNKE